MAENAGGRLAERRLVRRKGNRLIAGVAGGLADYTGLDPAVFRVTFVALVLFGGAGLVLYVLAWLLIPKVGSPESHGERLLKQLARMPWIVAGLVVIGAFMLARAVGFDFRVPSLAWALVLIAIGVVLLRRDRAGGAVAADVEPGDRARIRRERSPLGWITLGIAIVLTGIGALLHNIGAAMLEVGDYAALALLVVGTGLALGTWFGRARWLILTGAAMVPVVAATSFIDMPLRGAIGARYLYPVEVNEIPDSYELLVGNLTVDLSEVRFEGARAELDIDAAAGNVAVYVPRGVTVRLDAHTNLGHVSAFREYEEGFDSRVATIVAAEDPVGTLALDIEGGISDINVSRSYVEMGRNRRNKRKDERGRDRRRTRDRNERRDGGRRDRDGGGR